MQILDDLFETLVARSNFMDYFLENGLETSCNAATDHATVTATFDVVNRTAIILAPWHIESVRIPLSKGSEFLFSKINRHLLSHNSVICICRNVSPWNFVVTDFIIVAWVVHPNYKFWRAILNLLASKESIFYTFLDIFGLKFWDKYSFFSRHFFNWRLADEKCSKFCVLCVETTANIITFVRILTKRKLSFPLIRRAVCCVAIIILLFRPVLSVFRYMSDQFETILFEDFWH